MNAVYLAKYFKNGQPHYVIRQSYFHEDCFRHRDLLELGTHPEEYIVYPGGNAYYIDECIEDALNDQDVSCQGDQLEEIFWGFIDPAIRRVIESFSRKTKHQNRRLNHSGQSRGIDAHVFDKRRIHYLRSGRMDQGNIGRMPHQLLTILENKSRDEIEQYFMESEKILRPHELKAYVYVIFNLQRHFTQMTARRYPESLDKQVLDEYFLENICRLNDDAQFWQGFVKADGLNGYMARYVVMFFDYEFGASTQLQDYIKSFMNSRRQFRFPSVTKTVGWDEASVRLEIEKDLLRKMSKRELTIRYRKMAMQMHPDKGGDHEKLPDHPGPPRPGSRAPESQRAGKPVSTVTA